MVWTLPDVNPAPATPCLALLPALGAGSSTCPHLRLPVVRWCRQACSEHDSWPFVLLQTCLHRKPLHLMGVPLQDKWP